MHSVLSGFFVLLNLTSVSLSTSVIKSEDSSALHYIHSLTHTDGVSYIVATESL